VNVVGPFAAAQTRFFRGQVIPLCAGWFGEVNEDFVKIIRTLAKHAAAGDDGMTISPLINTDRKGGAFPIMLQQFKRAIGVAIVRGNAKHKLGRLHYVRATPEEAAAVCRAHQATIVGSQVKTDGQVGTRITCPKVTVPSSSSETGMNSTCIRCT